MARPTDAADSMANIPLGIDTDGCYSQVETHLDVGDLVLCYTDSLTESRAADGQPPLGHIDLRQVEVVADEEQSRWRDPTMNIGQRCFRILGRLRNDF